MDNKLKEAVSVLVEALKTDLGYRIGWQANIAMAFKDEFHNYMSKNHPTFKEEVENEVDIYEISNRAAFNFLNLLCKE